MQKTEILKSDKILIIMMLLPELWVAYQYNTHLVEICGGIKHR